MFDWLLNTPLHLAYLVKQYSDGNYIFKVNNRNTRTRFKICSKLTIITPEQRQPSFWFLHG